MNKEEIRLFVVDDNESLIGMIKEYFSDHEKIKIIGEAHNGEEGIEYIRNNKDSFDVSIKVTNSGKVAGKEVVEIYFQSPYTEYDKQNGIEKSAIELCGFEKTCQIQGCP